MTDDLLMQLVLQEELIVVVNDRLSLNAAGTSGGVDCGC